MSARARRAARGGLAAIALLAGTLGDRPAPASAEPLAQRSVSQASGRPVEASGPRPWLGVDLADAGRLPTGAELRALGALGVRAVRVDVRWADVEPRREAMDWSTLDAFASAADNASMTWVARIHASPAWSRRDPAPPAHWWLCRDARAALATDDAAAPPTDPADLAAFAAGLAVRWSSGPTAIEVWREPNLMPNWRAGGPDPEDYARLLVAVEQAVHAVRPPMRVLSAALAPTTELDPCVMDDVVFLGRLARTGALDAVDAVGIAPLGLRAGPDAPPDPDALGVGRAALLHRAVARSSVDAPLWALSFGWASGIAAGTVEPLSTGAADDRGAVPPARAADNLRAAWLRAAHDWPWLEATFVWGIGLDGGATEGRQPLTLGGDGSGTPLEMAIADVAMGGRLTGALAAAREGRAESAEATLVALDARGLRENGLEPDNDAGTGGWPAGQLGPASIRAGLILAGLAAGIVALRRRRDLAPRLDALLAAPRGWPLPAAAAGYGVAALVLWLSAGCQTPAGACSSALSWLVGVPALGLLAWLAASRPALATAAVAAAAPLAYAGRLAIGPVPVATVELLVALAVGGRMMAWYTGREPPRRPRIAPLDAAVIVLVAWTLLSLLWAPRPALALREWRTVLLEPAVFYALLRTAPNPRGVVRLALIGLAAGGTVAAVVGLGQVALGAAGVDAGIVAAEGVLRARGPYSSPNNLALILGRVAMLLGAAALAMDVPQGARRAARSALALVAAGLLATFSRGAVLFGIPAGTATVGWWLAPRRERRRAVAGLVLVLGATSLLLVPFAGTERVAGALSAAPGSTGYYRLQLWRSSWRMIQDHPLLGVGLDGFLYAYREVYVARDVIQERFLSHPHNLVLDWWTRLGLPGLLILGWLVAGHVALARRLAQRGRRGAVVAGALGMQAYGAAHGLIDNSFFLVDLAVATWLAQAALLAEDEAIGGPTAAVPAALEPPG